MNQIISVKRGSGRKTLTSKRPEIIKNLELIMENDTSGDPMKHLNGLPSLLVMLQMS